MTQDHTGLLKQVKVEIFKINKVCNLLNSCMYSSNLSEETSLYFLFRKDAMMIGFFWVCLEELKEVKRPEAEVDNRRMNLRATRQIYYTLKHFAGTLP